MRQTPKVTPKVSLVEWGPNAPASLAATGKDTAPGFARKRLLLYGNGYCSAATPTLFTLVDEYQNRGTTAGGRRSSPSQERVCRNPDAVPNRSRGPGVVCPRRWRIAWHVKNYSKRKKKPEGSTPPGRILQEIRRMCIHLRLMFWPGISDQGQQ